MFAALSLVEAGYTVFANADASGTFDPRSAYNANARMRDAGVYVMPQSAVASDLQRDWRNPPGVAGFLTLLYTYVWPYECLDLPELSLTQLNIGSFQILPQCQQRDQAARRSHQARYSNPRRGCVGPLKRGPESSLSFRRLANIHAYCTTWL